MFIGRERELSSLEKLYRSDKFEFAVVYGRRGLENRIAQAILLKIKILFILWELKATQSRTLKTLAEVFWNQTVVILLNLSFLPSRSALEYVFRRSEQERIILVIDEYPYVARSSKSFSFCTPAVNRPI